MKYLSTLLFALFFSSSAFAGVIDTFDATFKSALNQTPTLTKSTRDDYGYELTVYTYTYKGNLIAQLRTCTTSEGEILLSGTTHGTDEQVYDRNQLNELDNLMKSFYKSLPPSSIADSFKDTCVRKSI